MGTREVGPEKNDEQIKHHKRTHAVGSSEGQAVCGPYVHWAGNTGPPRHNTQKR